MGGVRDEERGRRIRDALEGLGLEAVVCSLPENVLLLSGYWPVVGDAIAVATREGQVAYSWMLGNWVYFALNACLVVTNSLGLGLAVHRRGMPDPHPDSDSDSGRADDLESRRGRTSGTVR